MITREQWACERIREIVGQKNGFRIEAYYVYNRDVRFTWSGSRNEPQLRGCGLRSAFQWTDPEHYAKVLAARIADDSPCLARETFARAMEAIRTLHKRTPGVRPRRHWERRQ